MSAIEVRELSEQQTAVARHRISMREANRIPEWIRLTLEAVQRAGKQPVGMPFLRTFSLEGDALDIEVGWPIEEPIISAEGVSSSTLPGGPAAVVSYFGPYEHVGSAYEAIQAWCRDKGYEIVGPPWESYFTDPHAELDQEKWRTDVHFPIKI
jgi:effector-binding domain-containing protein